MDAGVAGLDDARRFTAPREGARLLLLPESTILAPVHHSREKKKCHPVAAGIQKRLQASKKGTELSKS
jgi:hypothetical protein